MALYFIYGVSGTGKTTLMHELRNRGKEAHDTDEDGISDWHDNQTLESVERSDEDHWPPDWCDND